MPKLWDFDCECGARFEHMTMTDSEQVACPECGSHAVASVCGGRPFHVIVPMHRSSLKNKAGYVHTHGDRPAEKGSVAVPRNKGDF